MSLPLHRDPETFPGIVNRLDVEAILVVISSWMGPRLKQRMGSEDIWQETLFMAWRDRDQHDWCDSRSYRRWLLAIAKNRIRDVATTMSAQKRGGDKETYLFSTFNTGRDDDSRPLVSLPPDSVTPSRLAIQRERAQAMEDALDALPTEFRAAIRLRLFEQLPLLEVSKKLGVSLAAAKKRVYHGSELYRIELGRTLSRERGQESRA